MALIEIVQIFEFGNAINQAVQDYSRAIQLNPKDGSYYKNRGLAYQALGRNIKAGDDFAKAKQLGYNG